MNNKEIEILFGNLQEKGVIVYIDNGKVIIADEQNTEELLDTKSNREKFIAKAKELTLTWESESK